jgi:hypothetical protein
MPHWERESQTDELCGMCIIIFDVAPCAGRKYVTTIAGLPPGDLSDVNVGLANETLP